MTTAHEDGHHARPSSWAGHRVYWREGSERWTIMLNAEFQKPDEVLHSVCVCLCDLTCPGLVNANVARGTRRALFRITYIKLEYVHVYCIVRYPIQCASIHEGDKINGNVIYSNDPYGEIYNDRFWHTASKHFLFIYSLSCSCGSCFSLSRGFVMHGTVQWALWPLSSYSAQRPFRMKYVKRFIIFATTSIYFRHLGQL